MSLQNAYKLVTREDPYHLHKGLGITCLINFVYRYWLLLSTGTMALNSPEGIASIGLHGLLSISSLMFHLPNNRVKGGPMIYPEMRMHTIIFTLRSVLCCLSYYLGFTNYIRFAICVATMIAADTVTYLYNDKNQNGSTIRNMPYDTRVTEESRASVKLMNSQMQIGATLFMFGNIESAFFPLFAIQMAALLSTLVRKGIISANMWHLIYACSLWMNIALFYKSLSFSYVIIESVGYTLYTTVYFPYRTNKYMNWLSIFTLIAVYEHFCDKCIDGSVVEPYVRWALIMYFMVAQVYKTRGLLFLKD